MMGVELVLSLMLAGAALWLVLQPLLFPGSVAPDAFEPLDPQETRKGVAVAALKEIEFDRATGKLSDVDYADLYARYSSAAIAAMRADDEAATPQPAGATVDDAIEAMVAADLSTLAATAERSGPVTCPQCGPRPEADAVFCSECGMLLPHPALCAQCQAPLEPGGRFCGRCGVAVTS